MVNPSSLPKPSVRTDPPDVPKNNTIRAHRKRRSASTSIMGVFASPPKMPIRMNTTIDKNSPPSTNIPSPWPSRRSFTTPSPLKTEKKATTINNTAPPTMAFLSPDAQTGQRSSMVSPAKTPSKSPTQLSARTPVIPKTSTKQTVGDLPVAKAKAMLLAKSAGIDSTKNIVLVERKNDETLAKPTMLPTKREDDSDIPTVPLPANGAKENNDMKATARDMGSLEVAMASVKTTTAANLTSRSFESPRKPQIPTKVLVKRFEKEEKENTEVEIQNTASSLSNRIADFDATVNTRDKGSKKNKKKTPSRPQCTELEEERLERKSTLLHLLAANEADTITNVEKASINEDNDATSAQSVSLSKSCQPSTGTHKPLTSRRRRPPQHSARIIKPASELQARALLLKGITYTDTSSNKAAGKASGWVQSLFGTKETSEIPINNTNEPVQCTAAGIAGYWRFPEFEYGLSEKGSVGKTLQKVGSTLGLGGVGDAGVGTLDEVSDDHNEEEGQDIAQDGKSIKGICDRAEERAIAVAKASATVVFAEIHKPLAHKPSLASIRKVTATGIPVKSTPNFSLNPLIINPAIDTKGSTAEFPS